ncbi:hypothetical protein CEXT_650841 [Caerostris extrusa]|uniref:Uncharacterized protein n=1 Tax=Caerostris extrusa TaxID=172846 RepID=A0AAV4XF25_CAEEX|nr:hypothetical protein CEXT_650841 [Caerostris extrusa]
MHVLAFDCRQAVFSRQLNFTGCRRSRKSSNECSLGWIGVEKMQILRGSISGTQWEGGSSQCRRGVLADSSTSQAVAQVERTMQSAADRGWGRCRY